MAGDLEAQLRASLPGRATEVQDYAALVVARSQVEQAMQLLTSARTMVSIVLGAERAACDLCTEAALRGAQAKLDLDRAIKVHPAGKVTR